MQYRTTTSGARVVSPRSGVLSDHVTRAIAYARSGGRCWIKRVDDYDARFYSVEFRLVLGELQIVPYVDDVPLELADPRTPAWARQIHTTALNILHAQTQGATP
jgi:hypothetical protein